MKVFYLRLIGLIIIFFTFVFPSTAQRSSGITVQGKISVQQGSVEGAVIQMYMDGRRLDNYGVGADGNYKVELLYNHKYELVFVRQDNFPQKIAVDATLPRNVQNSDPFFPPFPVNVTLFTEIPGVDKSFSENTVLKIFYSADVDNFISETYYNDAQIAKLIEQAILQSQIIDKESEYLSKLTRAEQAELRREYNQLLEQAAKEYSNEQFLAALDGYKAASQIFPKEQFPKDRIAEINDLLGLMMAAAELDQAKLDRFNALISEADQLFNQNQYQLARNSYNRALSIKPTDQYATQQIKAIADILRKQLEDQQYNDMIAQADNSMRQLLYDDAINRFNEALNIKPNEAYPKSKLEEINGILAKQAKDVEKQANYREAMLEGNTLFDKQFYDKALSSFENALKFVPGDEAATTKIANVRRIMKETADKMMFDELIKSGDKLFKKKEYEAALNDYTEAVVILPADAYVNKQIEEINQILQLVENFSDLVFKADNQFINENYEASKSLYQRALEIKSDDKHSQERITEINGILTEKGTDDKYDNLIAQADNLLGGKDYENAKSRYNEALAVKPREKYPRDKISEIDALLQQIAKTDQDYQRVIARADELLAQKDYEKAKTEYVNAGKIKPDETYPPEMVAKVDGLIAEQIRMAEEAAAAEATRLAALQAEKDRNYSDAIARGDNLFNQKEYENSRTEYRTALTIKPEETYPQQRIDEIGTLLAQLSAAQKAYEDAIARGDREFTREGFDAAITAYKDAKSAKPEETYPDEQLAKIDSIVTTRARLAEEAAAAEAARLAALQAEKDRNYSDAIARGDDLFNQKEYENSRTEYRTALTIKPEETYPQQRIDEIGTLLAQLEQERKTKELLDKNYNDLIAQADRFFAAKTYEQSKSKYTDALGLKPDETYPKDRISEIDGILAQQAIDEQYRTIIVAADGYFKTENYLQARTEYENALDLKSQETYPKNQIAKIDDILQREQQKILAEKQTAEDLQRRTEEIAQMNQEIEAQGLESEAEIKDLYNQYVNQADTYFNGKQYNISRGWYYKAWDIKPDETYPPQRITEINRLVSSLMSSQRDRDYQQFIDLADSTFRVNEYAVARGWYNRALSVKADEVYPKNQLSEIETKIAERLAGQSGQQFTDNVEKASNAFDQKNYNVARFWYKKALELRPNDADVLKRLEEIQGQVQ